jgi:SH3-like domain-containing protein
VLKFILVFLLIPQFVFADKHVPYYKSLSKTESWLRHYPDLRDFKEQTEKFFLTHKGMPVKVIKEYQSVGNNYIDWYRIELFNGIKGWIYHSQLTQKRTLLILEDTELYALNSYDPDSLLTIQKGKILGPKTVDLLEVTPEMFKVSININDRKEIKGWIPRDNRIWGDDPKETQQDFD